VLLKRLIVGYTATNCYIFGSEKTREVIIIDPGFKVTRIIEAIDRLNCQPLAILLTHAHFDHGIRAEKIKNHYEIPLCYNKKDHDLGYLARKPADIWLEEGYLLKIGEITVKVLETPGHSPGSMCYYTKDVKIYDNEEIDGIIFTGDLIFRREIGRTDMPGGDISILFSSIRNKIMNNSEILDNFIIFPGHMDKTSIGEERKLNPYKEYFL
jgi:glyoxylase-like metal-dependent hydrolase (beta-lactamase superfamily II)